MNYGILLALILLPTLLCNATNSKQAPCTITLKPAWNYLETNSSKEQKFGGKWIVTNTIEITKKGNIAFHLTAIHLVWKGGCLNTLQASLYKKTGDKEFLPIEDNLLCDGLWNKNEQKLLLNFDAPFQLHTTDTLYLVLTVPTMIESIVQTGHFELDHSALPPECTAQTAQ